MDWDVYKRQDIYKVREGRIVDKKVSTKKLAIYAIEEGGTEEREIETCLLYTSTEDVVSWLNSPW